MKIELRGARWDYLVQNDPSLTPDGSRTVLDALDYAAGRGLAVAMLYGDPRFYTRLPVVPAGAPPGPPPCTTELHRVRRQHLRRAGTVLARRRPGPGLGGGRRA